MVMTFSGAGRGIVLTLDRAMLAISHCSQSLGYAKLSSWMLLYIYHRDIQVELSSQLKKENKTFKKSFELHLQIKVSSIIMTVDFTGTQKIMRIRWSQAINISLVLPVL